MQVSLLGSGTKMKAPIFLFHLQYEDTRYINSSVLSQPIKIEELGEEGVRRGLLGGFMFALGLFFWWFVFLFFCFFTLENNLCVCEMW